MHVRIELEKFKKNYASIKDLAIKQNQSRSRGSASCVIKHKLIFILCIARKMSAHVVYLLMIETPTEIHLSVDRYKKYGTFRDRGGHTRMCYLTIWYGFYMKGSSFYVV